MDRERMSKMRELFKICPKIQFFGLSSCFQDCRGGGEFDKKCIKGLILCLGQSGKFSV